VSLCTPGTKLIEQDHSRAVAVRPHKLCTCLLWRELEADHFTSFSELLHIEPSIVVEVYRLEFVPEVVEIDQVTQEFHELSPLDEAVPTEISGLVGTHQRRLVVKVWIVQHTAEHSIDNRFIDLSKRQPTVAVHVEFSKQGVARLLVRHHQLWRWLRVGTMVLRD
jgi:hypothetical protein